MAECIFDVLSLGMLHAPVVGKGVVGGQAGDLCRMSAGGHVDDGRFVAERLHDLHCSKIPVVTVSVECMSSLPLVISCSMRPMTSF